MSAIALCTDSSSLLGSAEARALGVEVVPVPVALDGTPLRDELELDEFYRRLRAGATATTSQPNPAEFAEAYRRAADRGAEAIVSIHLDRRVSGVLASAELAAQESRVPVILVDTATASFGVTIGVRAAAAAAAAGASARRAAQAASRRCASLQNRFAVHAPPGGRVPSASDWAILVFADGISKPVSACASAAEAAAAMAREILDGRSVHAAVGHASKEIEGAADALALELVRSDAVVAVERYRVGAAVGAHTGPDGFGAFWWPA